MSNSTDVNDPAAYEQDLNNTPPILDSAILNDEQSSQIAADESSSSSFAISSRPENPDFETPRVIRSMDMSATGDITGDPHATTVALDRARRKVHLEAKRQKLIDQIRADDELEIENAKLEQQILDLENKVSKRASPENYVDLVSVPTPPNSQSSAQPILPSLPKIPDATPSQGQLAILNYNSIIVLKGVINGTLADKFYQQSRQADFALKVSQCILPEAMLLIRLRVKTSYKVLKITEEEAKAWNPDVLDVREMAALIYQLYGSSPRTETPVQIQRAINEFNWGFDILDRNIEEESYGNFHKLLSDHYGPLKDLTPELNASITKQIYRKLPNHSEINKIYTDKTKKETEHEPDTVEMALDRYLSCIQDVRIIIESARAHALMGTKWFSGSTQEKQNTTTSSNTVVGYGQSAQRASVIPVLPQVRDTDYHEKNRRINNRCETCGKTNHLRHTCKLFGNRMANNSSTKWHFSAIGKAWRKAGHHEFVPKVTLEGWGTALWSGDIAPPGHIYADEPNPTGEEVHKAIIIKENPYRLGNRNYDNRDNYNRQQNQQNNNQYNNREFNNNNNNNEQYNNNREQYNDNERNNNNNNNNNDQYKRPRSESIQYVSALINTVRPKLLPVRIYLHPQGRMAAQTEVRDAKTVEAEADQITEIDSGIMVPATKIITTTTSTAKRARDPDQQVLTPTATKALSVKAEALLDSGCQAGDFINGTTLAQLGGTHHLRSTEEAILVCSGLDNTCLHSNVVLDVTIEFDAGDKIIKLDIPVRISNDSPLGCIIGIDTIIKYNIVQLVPHFFLSDTAISALRQRLKLPENKKQKTTTLLSDSTNNTPPAVCRPNKCPTECRECTPDGEQPLPGIVIPVCDDASSVTTAQKRPRTRSVHFDDTPLDSAPGVIALMPTESAPAQTPRTVAALIQEIEQLREVKDFGDEGIDYDKKDMFAPFRKSPIGDKNDLIDKITICGTPEQQSRIKALCVKYKHIFSDELDSQPAKIPPFDLKVDKKKWETYKNRGPVRQQSPMKQEEINKQVQEMVKAGIIEKSQSTYYSQVMLTAKPNGTWRFCVDYRAMNDATEDASWPIPNIADLLKRLGRSKADTFGVMDLTSGYHQAPLTLACRAFTAFITFAGVYQFTRLPFGPKRAPSYFQEQMATVVLAGMLYLICEMYLDDCIVYGCGTDEFCNRLEQIFSRFSDMHIFLKAIKCKLGMSEVEYVGKTISKDGLRMSDKQIKGVIDFPKPIKNTQLRSFLGFVNYFRDHVPNHSNVVHPLHAMIDHTAKKQTLLQWTKEGEDAFENIKRLISISPKLYFLHDTAPIVLETDASDYGVGGYLYQTIDGKQQLVALVSKALSETQLRWSVIQKEAYGIFFCCTHLDRMLRDRKFEILTDHKNLMFIKLDSNPMVVRWWMALQELHFTIRYIKGEENEIADALSRLCLNRKANAPIGIVSALIASKPLSTDHYSAIAACHNTMVGHGGVERTMKKLKSIKINWPYMRRDVWTFIQECPCCQKMSQVRPPVTALKYTTSTYRPMECINIDFIGPYPDKGYLLVVIDTFTRYVNIYPVPDATAKSALHGLVEHFGRYGSPKSIRSDNGAHFVNELIKQFLLMAGTSHDKTMAYSSEENSIVERCNKEINKHITKNRQQTIIKK